jgi:hypothetical protein
MIVAVATGVKAVIATRARGAATVLDKARRFQADTLVLS